MQCFSADLTTTQKKKVIQILHVLSEMGTEQNLIEKWQILKDVFPKESFVEARRFQTPIGQLTECTKWSPRTKWLTPRVCIPSGKTILAGSIPWCPKLPKTTPGIRSHNQNRLFSLLASVD